jgi:hypothetical protein
VENGQAWKILSSSTRRKTVQILRNHQRLNGIRQTVETIKQHTDRPVEVRERAAKEDRQDSHRHTAICVRR